jgi:hypothetical protein
MPLPGHYLATARGRISYLVLEVRLPRTPYIKVKYAVKIVCERRPIGEPEAITPGFMMAILRKASSVDPELVETIAAERVAKLRESVDQEIERRAADRVDDVAHRNKQAEKIATELEAITGVPVHEWNFDKDAIAAAYLLLKQTGLHRGTAWGFSELIGAAKNLRDVADMLHVVCTDERFAAIRSHLEGARLRKKKARAR